MNAGISLTELACPINWDLEAAIAGRKINLNGSPPREKEKAIMASLVIDKLRCDSKYALLDGSAAWQKISQYLTIAWIEYAKTESSPSEMRRYLDEADEFIKDTEEGSPLIQRYVNALKYLINAMWAHFYRKENNPKEVKDYLNFLTPVDEMDHKDQAAILALKSCVFMEFGPAGHTKALEAINSALELEGDQAEWHFLKLKCLSRHRRAHNHKSSPTEEELVHMRKAVGLNHSSASHHVFAGQSCVEYALYSEEARRNSEIQDAYMNECEENMTKAAFFGDSSPIILTRIAKGLMNLHGNRGADLLRHCVRRSFALFPESGLINHVAGNYYMYKDKNPKLAIFHLQKAALEYKIFGAFINLIDTVWKTVTEPDLEPLVEKFWEEFQDDPVDRGKAIALMASYNFFLKNDIVKAVTFWKEYTRTCDAKDSNPYSFIQCYDMTVPLIGEVQIRLKNTNANLSSDEEELYKSFLVEVLEARPKLEIATITRRREDVIRRALNLMSPEEKLVVSVKLPDQIVSKPPFNKYRIPSRREESRGRVLPTNWRLP